MSENITINMENLSEEEQNQLLALIEKANKPKNEIWKPKKDEIYWIINEYGKVTYIYAGLPEDDAFFSIGNCFRTKEEAEFVVERLKVIQQLKELANGFNPLKEKKSGWVLGYDLTLKSITTLDCSDDGYIFNEIPFETEEEAQNAINTIGEERLRKYYFCIEN